MKLNYWEYQFTNQAKKEKDTPTLRGYRTIIMINQVTKSFKPVFSNLQELIQVTTLSPADESSPTHKQEFSPRNNATLLSFNRKKKLKGRQHKLYSSFLF